MNDRVVWRVKRIQEADYGCEERPDGEKLKVLVTLENDQGGLRQLLVEDDWLYENGIDEGSEWTAHNPGLTVPDVKEGRSSAQI